MFVLLVPSFQTAAVNHVAMAKLLQVESHALPARMTQLPLQIRNNVFQLRSAHLLARLRLTMLLVYVQNHSYSTMENASVSAGTD